jgi:S-DNA-T family DNA segregation ATPase FtsK/SpoIIIE
MKIYTDVFKKPVSAGDVRLATVAVVRSKSASASLLQRQLKIGYGKAATLLRLLEDAGVVTEMLDAKPRSVILQREDTAINAALRQLRKGNG